MAWRNILNGDGFRRRIGELTGDFYAFVDESKESLVQRKSRHYLYGDFMRCEFHRKNMTDPKDKSVAPPVIDREAGLPAKPEVPLRDDAQLYQYINTILRDVENRIRWEDKQGLLAVGYDHNPNAAYHNRLTVVRKREPVFAIKIQEIRGADVKVGKERNLPYRAESFEFLVADDGKESSFFPIGTATFAGDRLSLNGRKKLFDSVSQMLNEQGIIAAPALILKPEPQSQPTYPKDWIDDPRLGGFKPKIN